MTSINIHGQTFLLHTSGAAYWQDRQMLLISDVHLGKISHFRKAGSAVPQNAVPANFEKLSAVAAYFRPAAICFLGDLFHSSLNKEWLHFQSWRKTISARLILVQGNHDIIAPQLYEQLQLEVVPELVWEAFLLTHEPEERAPFFNIAGHLHPGVRLRGKARQVLRLPCFFKTGSQLILPAFGEFTGKHILEQQNGAEVFVLGGEQVYQLPTKAGKP